MLPQSAELCCGKSFNSFFTGPRELTEFLVLSLRQVMQAPSNEPASAAARTEPIKPPFVICKECVASAAIWAGPEISSVTMSG